MGLKILGVITARGGSKGLPGKNIKMLGGKPLIAYTINAAKRSKLLTHLIVSTDARDIADVAKKYDADVPFIRPHALALDTTAHVPVLQHATKCMEEKLAMTFDIVVTLQPTSPFRTPDDIDGTIQELIATLKATSAVSICEVAGTNHPIKVKKLEGNRIMPYCMDEPEGTRRQDFPIAYKRSSAVYATRRDTLVSGNSMYGAYIVGYVVPTERSIDIDTLSDWAHAQYMLKELRKNGFSF